MADALPLFHRSLNLLRRGGNDVVRRLAELVQASALHGSKSAFHVRALGMRFQDFDGSAKSIERALEEGREATRADRDLPFVLSTARNDPALVLSYFRDPMALRGSYDRVEINFNLSRPLIGDGGLMTFAGLMKYVALCVEGFDADTAAVHDSHLFQIVGSAYTRQMSMRNLPRSQHRYIPVAEIVERTPVDLVKRLSHVMHPTSFDLTKIPPAVYWINYWSAKQVKTLGEDRVRGAGWGFLVEHPRGGLLLASQREEFDALNRDHLENLARIADRLDLYSVQSSGAKA